jgi:simple sugar transport system permease protein
MYRMPFGYELRMIGINIKFARYGGINTRRVIMLVMAISGVLAALAGAHLALGIHNKLLLNVSLGLGFEGIVVSLMARNNPALVPLTSLFYGYLRAGADIMERSSDMSREMVLVLQGIIIILITAQGILPIVQKQLSSLRDENQAAPIEGGD